MTTPAGVIKKADRTQLIVPTKEELTLRLEKIPILKHKILFTFLYLYGSRIEEVTGMAKKDKEGKKQWIVQPVKRHQLQIVTEEGRESLKASNLVILKRKPTSMGRLVRNITLPIEPEKDLVIPLINYINTLQPDDALFAYHPVYVWDLAKKYFGNNYFPHFFRHTRATRLASDYGFNGLDLAVFMGWADSRMAHTYAHLSTQDLARKIK